MDTESSNHMSVVKLSKVHLIIALTTEAQYEIGHRAAISDHIIALTTEA
jgi:hypothetical protein